MARTGFIMAYHTRNRVPALKCYIARYSRRRERTRTWRPYATSTQFSDCLQQEFALGAGWEPMICSAQRSAYHVRMTSEQNAPVSCALRAMTAACFLLGSRLDIAFGQVEKACANSTRSHATSSDDPGQHRNSRCGRTRPTPLRGNGQCTFVMSRCAGRPLALGCCLCQRQQELWCTHCS